MKQHTGHTEPGQCARAAGAGRVHAVLAAMLATAMACAAAPAAAQGEPSICGSLNNAYGPFDYRTDRDKLPIVEVAHFTPPVEMLVRGERGHLSQDIDYTLRAFPNHHRALAAIMRLAEREKKDRVSGAGWSVDCYFVRATQFRADDTTVRMLYATYLHKRQRTDEALKHLNVAREFAKDNPFTHYNLGLVYFDLGAHEQALASAHQAMALGFPRSDLKDKLMALGKWADAASAPP
jgi:tetratricopeptide (TPR) repeat protein